MALTLSVSDVKKGKRNVSFSGVPDIGDNIIVAAPGAGLSLHAHAFSWAGAGGDNMLYWKTGSSTHFGGSAGAMTVNADGPAGGVVREYRDNGYFNGASNEAIVLVASTAEPIFGDLNYAKLNANGIPL